jgi:hypothetical protein
MSLLTALRAGVSVADSVTRPLQPGVTFERYLSSDAYGEKVYAAPVALLAVTDWKQHQLRTKEGVLSVSRSSVQFLNINALVAATAGHGISDEDRITLPDGTTGPILDMSGFIDAGTGHPIATEVWIG